MCCVEYHTQVYTYRNGEDTCGHQFGWWVLRLRTDILNTYIQVEEKDFLFKQFGMMRVCVFVCFIIFQKSTNYMFFFKTFFYIHFSYSTRNQQDILNHTHLCTPSN